MSSRRHEGPIYIGVTRDLTGRVWEHKNNQGSKHVQKYNIKRLVYFEEFGEIDAAISREKRLKKWNRGWKDDLIAKFNPDWDDLYNSILD
jgi:putative endonuclease